jgi:PAS domain S-box-containing protein
MIEILLIEDNLSQAELIKEMLSEARQPEFFVQHVRNLAEGLSQLQSRDFDAVLVDLGLPDSQGLETALTVRRQSKRTPVIALTVLDDEETALKSLQMDIQDYLIKGDINGALLTRSIRYAIQRKRDFETLRESENRYRTLFNAIDEAFCIIEVIFDENEKPVDYRFLETNPSFGKQTGLIDAQGKRMRELAPKHEEHWFETYGKIALTGQPARFQNRADQLHRWYDVYAFRFGQPENRQVAILFNDITERKQAEAEIQRLASFPLMNPNPVLELNADGQMIFCNPAAKQIVENAGYNNSINPLIPQDMPVILQNLRDKKAGQYFREVEINGRFFEELVYIAPQLKSVRIYTMDITERKRAEEALRKSELKMSTIFHAVPALIGITTMAEGRCIDINEAGLRTLGYRREEIVGRSTLELGLWESRSERDRMIRLLEEQGYIRDLEITFRSKNGETFTGIFSAEPIDFEGEPYLLSIVNDITERKKMEKEITRLNADLAGQAAELGEANRELEAFNYTVAHDLRKPLTVINGYCQAIKALCNDSLDEACKGYLRETYDGTLRMNRLIDALLKFSSMAQVEPLRETVDLSAMAHEVAEELKLAEPERRVAFRIAEIVLVDGDANLLRIVLDNLLGNAWKYTGMRDEAVIEFGVTQFDGKQACFVRDNGAGFAMADAEKIFVPFQRLPGSEEFKGFGIGLATVARIIERHGGRIWAEGEPNKGATFCFTLRS